MDTKPLIVIVGPTASGKTSLAIELAERLNGEIICADSRTVYKGMDIGTAKPTKEEQARVPHWGIDLVDPDQTYTAAQFQRYATEKIREVRERHHVPLLVGGTGLYIDSVLFDYQFGPKTDAIKRQELEKKSTEELIKYCKKYNISLPENSENKRYIMRAIEQTGINKKRINAPLSKSIIVGISTNKNQLVDRIRDRTEQLFDDGVVEEAIKLGKKYGWKNEAMTGNIYPLIYSHLYDRIPIEEIKTKFTTLDWRLAKRQMTWFQRNPYTEWLTLPEAKDYIVSRVVSE